MLTKGPGGPALIAEGPGGLACSRRAPGAWHIPVPAGMARRVRPPSKVRRRLLFSSPRQDRKSTRLNSSHVAISYAVFCLKKKKRTIDIYHLIMSKYT